MRGLVLAAVLLSLLGAGFTPQSEWSPRELPVSFWCGPPDKYLTIERFREIADAGFNVVTPPCEGAATAARNRKILDLAKSAGLTAFVADERMPLAVTGVADATIRLDAIVRDYSKHPALAGYFLTDEPNTNAFEGLKEVVAYLREKDPKHPAFINLFPNYANVQQLGALSYEGYINQYARTVKPAFISYDHYHFLKDSDRPGYFTNLNVVQRIAAKSELPFWQIVLAVPHGPYRPLTEAEKRWQVMQTLAYGGKGVLYFTYWTPNDPSFQWGPAIINREGVRTPQYDEVKRINADVKALSKYLLTAVHAMTFQTGHIAPGGIPRVQGTPVVFPGEGDVTVGLFRADTHLYVLFANRDYRKATSTDVLLSSGETPTEKLDKSTGRWQTVKGMRNDDGDLKVRLDVAPGDAELYRW